MMPVFNIFRKISLALLVVFVIASCQSHQQTYRISSAKRPAFKTRKYEPKQQEVVNHREAVNHQEVVKVTRQTSSLRSDIVAEAEKYIGITYHYGGKTPSPGFDCSGFLTYVFGQKGLPIRGSSKTLAKMGRKKSINAVETGDLAFFGSNGKVTHVALVVDQQDQQLRVIHSTSTGGVRIDDVFSSSYWKSKYLFSRSIIEE